MKRMKKLAMKELNEMSYVKKKCFYLYYCDTQCQIHTFAFTS